MATTSNQHYLIRNTNLRNELLKQTDFYMLNDVYNKLTETQQKEIIDYRQALRDFININRDKYLIDGIGFVDFPPAPAFAKITIPKY